MKIREQKFRKILRHAYSKSPFYRNLYSEKGIRLEDLDEIPITELPYIDKQMLLEHMDEILTVKDLKADEVMSFAYDNKDPAQLFQKKYQIVHSSGSSGTPGISVYNMEEMSVAFSCSSRMHLFEMGKKNKVAYYAGIDGRFGGVSLVLQGRRGLLKNMYDMCLLDMNEPLEKTIDILNNYQPNILVGYGTGLTILSQKQAEGKLKIKPRVIENGGEGLTDTDYNQIKHVFNVPIVNMYAASESYFLGIGKEEYEGIYLMDDFNYIEIMEDHILVTNLFNYTQSTIRYRINDKLTLKDDHKKLLPFRLVDSIVGREEALIWFRNEKNVLDYIHPVALTSFCIKGIQKFQIILTSETSFEFLAVLDGDSIEQEVFQKAKEGLDTILKRKEMCNVLYEIKKIERPEIDKKTRKFKMVIKNY